VVVGLLLAAAGSADAGTTIVVNTRTDAPAVDPLAGPDSDAVTPGDQITLRSAIQHVNTLPDAGLYIIELSPAEVHTLTLPGHAEQDAAAGDLDIKRNLTIRSEAQLAWVDAEGLGDRVFDVVGPVRLRLERVRTLHGTAVPGVHGVESGGGIRGVPGSIIELGQWSSVVECSATGGPEAHGGGIDAGGDLRIDNAGNGLAIQLCTADGDGGGARVAGQTSIDGLVRFQVCAAGGDGGGLHASGGVDLRGYVDGLPAEFTTCSAGGSGGGIYLAPAAGPMVADLLYFRECRADEGGAMALGSTARVTDFETRFNEARNGTAVWASGDVTLERGMIRFEEASERGGGVFVAPGGSLTLRDTFIEDSESGVSGGSVYVGPGASLDAHGSTFHDGNTGVQGGNIDNHGMIRLSRCRVVYGRFMNGGGTGAGVYNAGSLVAINTLFAANSAQSGTGGAIDNTGDVYAVHCNFTGNLAAQGAAIYGAGSAELSHSIVAWNNGPSFSGTAIASRGWNFDADGSGALTGPGDQSGDALHPINPLFAIETYVLAYDARLRSYSPCLNAGDPSASVDELGNPILEDFRGMPRPLGPPDIGAYETCPPDLGSPFGVLNFEDITRYLEAWNFGLPAADFALPSDVLNFFDIAEFIKAFRTGC
jgi:hypothetical protein